MDRVKDIIPKVMTDLSSGKSAIHSEIHRLWPRVCQKKATQHTEVVGLEKGALLVNVDSPAWLFQMNLQKRRLLKTLKEQIPELSNIRFKIGKVK